MVQQQRFRSEAVVIAYLAFLGTLMAAFRGVDELGTVCDGPAPNCRPPVDYLQFGSVLLLGEGAQQDHTECISPGAPRHRKNV